MKCSDFKHIVKESLREAFYTKKNINEALVGKKLFLVLSRKGYYNIKWPALLSKNTIPKENPYRISWFEPKTNEPAGHIDLTKIQFDQLINGVHNKSLEKAIADIISSDKRIHIQVEFLFLKEVISNETLFLMEESARELELFIDNKRPA